MTGVQTCALPIFEGNFPYLLLATLARLLLEGGELHTSHDNGIQREPASPRTAGKLVLMEYHHADASTRLVFDDVKAVLGLPFLNTDYRALARWPSYFALAWADLRPRLQRGEYETLEQIPLDLHQARYPACLK